MGFLPIYIGPTLMIVLWWFVVRKMIRIAKLNRITSLADFIASRYGRSALIGGLVTVIAVIGILPYISLQLKAVSTSFQILLQYPEIVMPQKIGDGLDHAGHGVLRGALHGALRRPAPPTMKFDKDTFVATESDGSVRLLMKRSGSTRNSATVTWSLFGEIPRRRVRISRRSGRGRSRSRQARTKPV